MLDSEFSEGRQCFVTFSKSLLKEEMVAERVLEPTSPPSVPRCAQSRCEGPWMVDDCDPMISNEHIAGLHPLFWHGAPKTLGLS